MGMIKCELHGLSGITQCCSHVGTAIDGGLSERTFILIDGWNNPNVLCARCHPRALGVVIKNREAQEKTRFDFDFGDGTNEATCTRCLGEWFVATGQGELSDRVAEARAGLSRGA